MTAKGKDGKAPKNFDERLDSIDYKQVLGYVSFSLFNTPLMHTYYTLTRTWAVGSRIATNLLVMDPINVAAALLINGTNKAYAVEGTSPSEALATGMTKLQSGFQDKMTMCFMVWPPLHTINNLFVPLQYRVLGGNIGSFGWHTWLTWKLWREERELEESISDTENSAPVDPTVVVPVNEAAPQAIPVSVPPPTPKTPDPLPSAAPARQCPFRSTFPSQFVEPDESKCLRPGLPSTAAPVEPTKPSPQAFVVSEATTSQHESGAVAPALSRWWKWWPLSNRPADCDARPTRVMTASDLEGFLACKTLVGADGKAVPVASLVGKTLALYFSASWCPPCKRFTPKLVETYEALQQAHPDGDVEFIFVSLDSDKAFFKEYHGHMPWPALPYDVAQDWGRRLQTFFGARGVPWLVTIKPDGTVANANAVRCVGADAQGKDFPWEGFS